MPTPCLITHYLLERSGARGRGGAVRAARACSSRSRIRGSCASATTRKASPAATTRPGCSAPFLEPIARAPIARKRVAVLLHDAGSIEQGRADAARDGPRRHRPAAARRDRVLRGRAARRGVHGAPAVCGDRLPGGDATVRASARGGGFDYVILFESSGMYRGEDLVALASHLAVGRLDAVWGSRRLSVRDIQESYRLRYRKNALLGADQLRRQPRAEPRVSVAATAATFRTRCRPCARCAPPTRSIRAIDLTHKRANQQLLSELLRRKAEILEIPVQFFPISPERVKRTSPLDGLQALGTIVWRRLAAPGTSAASTLRDAEASAGRAHVGLGSLVALATPDARLLVIPAAGLGSRLGANVPKVLVPVAGGRCSIACSTLYRRACRSRRRRRRPCVRGRGATPRRTSRHELAVDCVDPAVADRHARRDPARRYRRSQRDSARRASGSPGATRSRFTRRRSRGSRR